MKSRLGTSRRRSIAGGIFFAGWAYASRCRPSSRWAWPGRSLPRPGPRAWPHRDGRTLAHGLRVFPQRRHSQSLVAERRQVPIFNSQNTFSPLEPFKSSIQVLGGLNHRTAYGGPDGAGDHARGNGTFLTGVRLKKSATDIRAGVSIDQLIARQIGQLTRFPSLELATDAIHKSGACDSGYACAYQYNLSWSSPTTPMTPETNPRLVFERLFGSGAPGERHANLERRRHEQRSVLDFVLAEARSMHRRLQSGDKDKLDQYLTGVRELETRIEKVERFGEAADPAIDTPVGIPADYAEYIQMMYDILVLAFQTDSTRVATLMLAHDGSNRSFDHIGIVEGHHDLTHHRNRSEWIDKVADIDQWYVSQFARFLDKLEQAQRCRRQVAAP